MTRPANTYEPTAAEILEFLSTGLRPDAYKMAGLLVSVFSRRGLPRTLIPGNSARHALDRGVLLATRAGFVVEGLPLDGRYDDLIVIRKRWRLELREGVAVLLKACARPEDELALARWMSKSAHQEAVAPLLEALRRRPHLVEILPGDLAAEASLGDEAFDRWVRSSTALLDAV